MYLKKKQLYLDLRSAFVENDYLISEIPIWWSKRDGGGEERSVSKAFFHVTSDPLHCFFKKNVWKSLAKIGASI